MPPSPGPRSARSPVGDRGRQHPREAALSPEEQTARASARHRATQLGAARAPDGARRAGPGLHLLLGLRHRGDADPDDALHRAGRLQPAGADHPGHSRRPVLRHPVVPRRDPVLHQGGRRLRGGPGQLRAEGGPGRRGGAADRLHGHGGRADGGRHGQSDQCHPEPGQHHRHGGHHGRRRAAPPLRQPARHPRGRAGLRHPDLLLRGLPGHGHHRRLRQEGRGRPAPHPRPAQQRALRGAPRDTERLGLADGAGLHLPPALVRQRRLVADRPGGHLQRGGQLPSSGLAARPPDPGRDELGAGLPRAGHHAAGQVDPCAALRQRLADRGLPRGRGHLRAGHRLLHRGDRHHPHPLHRGQHQLQRLPVPGQLRGRRPLPAPIADPAGPPPGLLQRDPRAGRGLHRPGPGVQGPGRRAGGALRHRRVHRLHHGGRGHGQAPPHPQGGALAPERA